MKSSDGVAQPKKIKKPAKTNGNGVHSKPMNGKLMTGHEFARILKEADALLNDDDRRQIADGIEEARRFMNHGHIH